MQLRRAVLLFALVLGMSALVASLAPPPERRGERDQKAQPDARTPPRRAPTAAPVASGRSVRVQLPATRPGRGAPAPTRRVPLGSSVELSVSTAEPGEVVVDELGLRQAADPRAPAVFSLIAGPQRSYDVFFVPLRGEPRLAGRIAVVARR